MESKEYGTQSHLAGAIYLRLKGVHMILTLLKAEVVCR